MIARFARQDNVLSAKLAKPAPSAALVFENQALKDRCEARVADVVA